MTTVALPQLSGYLGTWDSYINDMLCSGDVKDAAIYDLHGRQLSSSSARFSLSLDEFAAVVSRIQRPPAVAKATDIVVGGTCYRVHLADGVYGIMARNRDGTGCTVAKTRRLLIVATHDERMNADRCNEVAMGLVDFFLQKSL